MDLSINTEKDHEDFSGDKAISDYVWNRIRRCEEHQDQQKAGREKALEYYNNEIKDLDCKKNLSTTVSPDLRATVKKIMPSISRTLFGNDKIVEYEPNEEHKEDVAMAASDYINHVLVPNCNAENAIKDAIFDAFIVKTGILKWCAYKSKKVTIIPFENEPQEILEAVDDEEDIVDISKNKDGSINFKYRVYKDITDIKLISVPRGAFLIDPDADSIEESGAVGEREILTRSELVERGYDKDIVWKISTHNGHEDNEDELERKGDDYSGLGNNFDHKAMDLVEVYEMYIRIDKDNDGIAELYKIVICDSSSDDDINGERIILEMSHADEVPYSAVVCERDAHQFEGHSIAEDVMMLQKLKTDLTRQMNNNVHWQSKLQPAYDDEGLTEEGEEALLNPTFGKPIPVKAGRDVREVVNFLNVPFVGDKISAILGQLDAMIKENTGITDQSGGLDPSTFQNMTATTAQIMNQAGAAQAEMILRSLSRGGIQKAFQGILRLVVSHQSEIQSKKINGKWQQFNPSDWDGSMKCSVNIGLGAGSREQDMAVMQVILNLQEKLIAAFGNDNPFVKPSQLYNTIAKMTEVAGFNSPELYFTKPDDEQIKQQQTEKSSQPSPEEQKMQAEMQMKQAEKQMRIAVEKAQMEADERVEVTRSTMQKQIKEMEILHKAELELARLNQKDQHHADKMVLEHAKLQQQQNDGAYYG